MEEESESYSTDWETESTLSTGCDSPISVTDSEHGLHWEFNGVQLNPDHLYTKDEGANDILLDARQHTNAVEDQQIFKQDSLTWNEHLLSNGNEEDYVPEDDGTAEAYDGFSITKGGNCDVNEDTMFDAVYSQICAATEDGVSGRFSTAKGGKCGANKYDAPNARYSTIYAVDENGAVDRFSTAKGGKCGVNEYNEPDARHNPIYAVVKNGASDKISNTKGGYREANKAYSQICALVQSSASEQFNTTKGGICGVKENDVAYNQTCSLIEESSKGDLVREEVCTYDNKIKPKIKKNVRFNLKEDQEYTDGYRWRTGSEGEPEYKLKELQRINPNRIAVNLRCATPPWGSVASRFPGIQRNRCIFPQPPTAPKPEGARKSGRPFKLISIASPPPLRSSRFLPHPPPFLPIRPTVNKKHSSDNETLEYEEVLPLEKIKRPFNKISKKLQKLIKNKKKQKRQGKYEDEMLVQAEPRVERNELKGFQRIKAKLRMKSNRIDPIDAVLQFADCSFDKHVWNFPVRTPKKLITPTIDSNALNKPINIRLRKKIRREYIRRRRGVTSFVPVTKLANIAN